MCPDQIFNFIKFNNMFSLSVSAKMFSKKTKNIFKTIWLGTFQHLPCVCLYITKKKKIEFVIKNFRFLCLSSSKLKKKKSSNILAISSHYDGNNSEKTCYHNKGRSEDMTAASTFHECIKQM